MAKDINPSCKQCRREGCKLFLKGERCVSGKCSFDRKPLVPGQHGAGRKKVTEYGLQLREKQKVKRAYGVMEKQFKTYYDKAQKSKEATGFVMLQMLERRLDNVVFKMGIGSSRAESRQIVNHGHITVNGKKVDIPSYQISVGDIISIKENKRGLEMFKQLKGMRLITPKWLEFNADKLEGKILALPQRDDIDLNIQEHLIVELYSR